MTREKALIIRTVWLEYRSFIRTNVPVTVGGFEFNLGRIGTPFGDNYQIVCEGVILENGVLNVPTDQYAAE